MEEKNDVHARLKILENNQDKIFGRIDRYEHRISVTETEVGQMKSMDAQAVHDLREIREEVNKLRRVIAWASGAIAVLVGGPTFFWTMMRIFN